MESLHWRLPEAGADLRALESESWQVSMIIRYPPPSRRDQKPIHIKSFEGTLRSETLTYRFFIVSN